MVTELVLIFLTFVFLLQYFMEPVKEPFVLYIGLFFGAILVVEKLVTIYHARHFIKEYIPMEKRFNRIPQPKPVSRTGVKEPGEQFEEERYTFS